jgi:hypothetical protein
MRVWIWHNGDDPETLAVIRKLFDHPRIHTFHHSLENKMLRKPTNWFWERATGDFLSKVDDDCLMPAGWGQTLRQAHADAPRFGVIGCWMFREEDFMPDVAGRKLGCFGGHQLLQNLWVGGSGYVMKRECVQRQGLLHEGESFPQWCIRLGAAGYINGWYYPFLYQDHMDDPRSEHTMMRTEEDFLQHPNLSSRRFGTPSLEAFRKRAHLAAVEVQQASINPRDYIGWTARLRRLQNRLLGRGRFAKFNA